MSQPSNRSKFVAVTQPATDDSPPPKATQYLKSEECPVLPDSFVSSQTAGNALGHQNAVGRAQSKGSKDMLRIARAEFQDGPIMSITFFGIVRCLTEMICLDRLTKNDGNRWTPLSFAQSSCPIPALIILPLMFIPKIPK